MNFLNRDVFTVSTLPLSLPLGPICKAKDHGVESRCRFSAPCVSRLIWAPPAKSSRVTVEVWPTIRLWLHTDPSQHFEGVLRKGHNFPKGVEEKIH